MEYRNTTVKRNMMQTHTQTYLYMWKHILYLIASLLSTVKLTPAGRSSTSKDTLGPSLSIAHSLHQQLVDICAVPALSICHGSQKTNDHVSAVARLYVWCHTKGETWVCWGMEKRRRPTELVRNELDAQSCQQGEACLLNWGHMY